MTQELFLYDNDKGLFKEILKKSAVMKGNYHVSPNGGNDLNTSNLDTYVKDPVNGMQDLKKYPMCVCFAPRSRIIYVNGQEFEQFVFHLYFLTTTYRNSDNSVKMRDRDTNRSAHHIWYDWQDMKTCAVNFLATLERVLRSRTVLVNRVVTPIKTIFNLEKGNVVYNRLTKFYNDNLSGVSQTFSILTPSQICIQDEYDIDAIIIPETEIHTDEQ